MSDTKTPAEVAAVMIRMYIDRNPLKDIGHIVVIINEALAEERAELKAFRDQKERARTVVSCCECKRGEQYKFMVAITQSEHYCQSCAADKIEKHATELEANRKIMRKAVKCSVAVSCELVEVLERHDRMASLMDEAFEIGIVDGGGIDGLDIQEMFLKYGVVTERVVTQVDLDEDRAGDCELGDIIYFRKDWLETAAERHNRKESEG